MTKPTHFITTCLKTHYQINVVSVEMLSIGADINASIYKVEAHNGIYFVKLKYGDIGKFNSDILELLHAAKTANIIHPIRTVDSNIAQQVDDVMFIVYPFINGHDGFSCALTHEQWIALGQALKQVHCISVPEHIKSHIRSENFSSTWHNIVRSVYTQLNKTSVHDDIALSMCDFLKEHKSTIQKLVERAEQLSEKINPQKLTHVLCHADIHAGNVFIDNENNLFIVDWDNPMLAPKERDLMFIGGGVANVWNNENEIKLFYKGYGNTDIDWNLLAYYRYERIIEDIAEYTQDLLWANKCKNRAEMYGHFLNMFKPNGVVEIAFKTDNNATKRE